MNEALVVLVRGVVAFFTLLIFARLLGKQQLSQLTFFDYILSISIGSVAASLTTDLSTTAWSHWVGLATWTGLVLAVQFVSLKWRKAAKYIEGEPVMVVMNGQIMEEAMSKIRYRVSELLEQLREKGVFDLAQVEFAVLEADGKLSVLKKSQYQSVTPKDLNISTQYSGLSTELIYDGVIIDQNLKQLHVDRPWLYAELRKQGINDPSEVLLAALDTNGNLYVDRYSDNVKNPTDASDYYGPN